MPVLGVGGIFLRAQDRDALSAWYREPLGVGAGVEVLTKPECDPPEVGRFARLHVPQGNAVELWEPPAA